MQKSLFLEQTDYSGKDIMIGLSGGINSMAVLCWLANYPQQYKPKILHLFYAHFEEHSPDTLNFVLAGVKYAKENFKSVVYTQTNNSVLSFFEDKKMIPHPMVSPCTHILKITPMLEYMVKNKITIDLVGYVRTEQRRIKRMAGRSESGLVTNNSVNIKGIEKHFPISDKDNEWCFSLVKQGIGWYPKIYDIRHKGKRVFHHNNCLPCKNMNLKDFELVKKHYPEYWQKAQNLAESLQLYWGRSKNDFYTTFGRKYQPDGQTCSVCAFD